MPLVQVLTYVALAVAFAAMIAKVFRYLFAPQHLRWELYPVPHEKGRAKYGGSYLEELDWWSKSRRSDLFTEIKEMMGEILLLKGVYLHNRRVWLFSFPFHFGLYLCICWLFLLLFGSILQLAGVGLAADAKFFGALIHYLTIIFGYAGLLLAGAGALGLLQWRISDRNQRGYNSPAEYINLVFLIVVIAVTLTAGRTLDPTFALLRGYVGALVSFTPAAISGSWFVAEVVLISLIIMYIPLTRMSHFVAKYFLYHSVRWNDKPNARGSKIEKSLMELLSHKVGWSASHIQTGKPWTEVVKKMKDE
ncbi:MAG: hypothetical protein JSV44_00370 [Candidatus Zixiibacteriota bacterium]|nr:MAG: hypothetical protein JSV44_00370 [candidate division Zixibacteria bacterium]